MISDFVSIQTRQEENEDLLVFINENRLHLTKERTVSSRIKSDVYMESSSVY